MGRRLVAMGPDSSSDREAQKLLVEARYQSKAEVMDGKEVEVGAQGVQDQAQASQMAA